MPDLFVKKARELGILTDKEMERIVALYLLCKDTMKPTNDQYTRAVEDLGGTVGSFKFAISNAVKKMKDANCYIGTEGAAGGKGGARAGPEKNGAAKTNKRKVDSAGEDDDEENVKVVKKGRGGYNGREDAVKMEDDMDDQF